jgi:hypothetical protein
LTKENKVNVAMISTVKMIDVTADGNEVCSEARRQANTADMRI